MKENAALLGMSDSRQMPGQTPAGGSKKGDHYPPRGFGLKLSFCIALIAALAVAGCNLAPDITTSRDTTAPAEVRGLTVAAGDQRIDLTWTDPPDSDFEKVRITRNGTIFMEVAKGGQTYIVGGTNGVPYTLTVQTVDAAGNVSTGITRTATPRGPDAPVTAPPPALPGQVAAPTYTWGISGNNRMVTLATTTSQTDIYYTVASTPIGVTDWASIYTTRYTGPFAVKGGTILRAIGVRAGWTNSGEMRVLVPDPPITYGISLTWDGWPDETVRAWSVKVTITNTGNQPTGDLAAYIVDDAGNPLAFKLSPSIIPSIAVGGTGSFTVTAKPGLLDTYYDAYVDVTRPYIIPAKRICLRFVLR